MIRLFIIEDNLTIIVSGFKRLFFPARDGIDIVGTCETVENAISTADVSTFDLFVLDLWLENRLPIQNIRLLKKQFPDKPILIYTSENSLTWKRSMLKEGATGYVTKKANRAELKSAIEKTSIGENYFPVELDQIAKKKNNEDDNPTSGKLTSGQIEILNMVATGMKYNEIAGLMTMSESNLVKTLMSLRQKYNVRNNTALISHLKERGEI